MPGELFGPDCCALQFRQAAPGWLSPLILTNKPRWTASSTRGRWRGTAGTRAPAAVAPHDAPGPQRHSAQPTLAGRLPPSPQRPRAAPRPCPAFRFPATHGPPAASGGPGSLLLCPAACRAPSSPSSPGLGSHAREPSRGWSPPSQSHRAHPRPLACADPAKGPWGSMPGESILVPTCLGSALSHWRHARRSPSPHSVPSGTQLRSLTWIPGPQPRD